MPATSIPVPRLLLVGALLLALLGTGLVVSSYRHLSVTIDEPNHLAAGLEWWQMGTYRLWRENPPLARIAVALGPHAAGLRLPWNERIERRYLQREENAWTLGTRALYGSGRPAAHLTRARLGNLPFFWLLLAMAGIWAYRYGRGLAAALLAIGFLATLPPLLAHAGLATTDLAAAATLVAALFAFLHWIRAPSLARAAILGSALGLAVASKLSALAFFPAAMLAMLVALQRTLPRDRHPGRRQIVGLLIAGLVTFLTVWGLYRFSWGAPVDEPHSLLGFLLCFEEGSAMQEVAGRAYLTPQPAPELLLGLGELCAHDKEGHAAYALGRRSDEGFWFFYPLALAVKTPLPFLAFVLFGGGVAVVGAVRRRDGWVLAPALAVPAVLAVALLGHLNLGVRHVLGVYPLLAVVAAIGAARWLGGLEETGEERTPEDQPVSRRRVAGVAVFGLLLLAQAVIALRAHPHHLAYFNPLAGSEPGEVLVDSDLDWGQGVVALERYFRGRDVERLHIAYFGAARLCEHDLPALEWLHPGRPVTGWVAVSEQLFRGAAVRDYRDPCDRDSTGYEAGVPVEERYAWLRDFEPVARVAGGAIRIYRIPDD